MVAGVDFRAVRHPVGYSLTVPGLTLAAMQLQSPRKPAPGVVFDSSLDDGIDQVLALALLFGLEGARQARVSSVSTSRYDLPTAAFLDLIGRFFGGQQPGDSVISRNAMPIGMSTTGRPATMRPAMLTAVLEKRVEGKLLYPRGIVKVNDTADPVALVRNALSAQVDGNAAVVLAGSPANLLQLLSLPDGRQWVADKARVLSIAGGRFDGGPADPAIASDVAGFRALLAGWPSPVVMAGAELSDALPYPGSSIESSFASQAPHPIADAYRAFRPMPYDAPSRALAATLYAARPDEEFFRLSEPGTITVTDEGRTTFTPSAAGRHRYLILEAAQRERVAHTYVELVSAEPRRPERPRPAAAANGSTAAIALLTATLALGIALMRPTAVQGQADAFDAAVRPILTGTCAQCHNDQLLSGGLSVSHLTSPDTLVTEREVWEKILRRVRAGSMPPSGVRKPATEAMDAMAVYVERAFERADAAAPPDPGRVTAHRLNRQEYANTIRDLLGVRFRADKDFPADDSADGFDVIAQVLTVSPLLMERYMAAAERIARWTLSTDHPAKPVEAAYRNRDRNIRRIDRSTIEADHRVDFAGEYIVRFGLPGERQKTAAGDAAPVTLGFWMDGALLATKTVETRPSGLVYFNPYSEEELRVYLPPGDHVFRAAFIDDAFVGTLTGRDAYDDKKNKFLDSMVFVGPYASAVEHEGRTRVLVCDPHSGATCVERILSELARRADRRPVTPGEVRQLVRFVELAQAEGDSVEQGLQLAIQAMLVSPHFLFHIERDADSHQAASVHEVSPYELASRLSYFLWSSMPDEELFALAASGRLRDPAVLAAQVDRMLASPRASALAANFAGQWLEIRNLDSVSPDPRRFPEWDAGLRDAMRTETTLFFEYILRENRPISEFLDARYTFLNERLATHYGIDGVTGPEFRRVALTTDRRGGVLSQASVLTVSSYPTRTSPVIRGKYVLQNLLGAPPPPPPPDVPSLDDSGIGELRSMREQLEQHRANPACAACHRNMDPLGFGLENYDAIGRWRDNDGKFPVDARGVLPNGQSFAGAGEMRALLVSQLPQFSQALTEKMLVYALHRGLDAADRRTVNGITSALAADHYRFQTLVHEIVKSLPFRYRRGEAEAR
jgi:mono/diheme cytochrome c family protein